jgi:YebC/PmpR family DNA-binding regulatory protein
MSGHSHWAGIRYKKAANDAKRGKVWSKIARLIIVAARAGGGDPAANLSLRYATVNMPKDTIEKAIKRGTGELGGQNFEEVLYEGYGPGGVAIMIEALTDNRNRTAPEVKRIFERRGGSMGTSGCVSWMFNKKGLITVNRRDAGEEELMEMALAAGAEDMTTDAEVFEITCEPAAYEGLKNALQEREIPIQVAEISMIPQNDVAISDAETAKKIIGLMEDLEDHDDIQNVYSNFDIPDEIIAKVGSS